MNRDHIDQETGREAVGEVLTSSARRTLLAETTPGWRFEAPCASVDPDAWFPEHSQAPDRRVFRLCAECPVRRSCLATALSGRDLGVWAGTTEETRRPAYRMLRRRVPAAEVLDVLLDRAALRSRKPRRRRRNPWSGAETTSRGSENAA